VSAAGVLGPASVPRLAPGVRLRHDPVRSAWVMLAPERVVFPDEIALEVLRRCDGAARVQEIAAELASSFDAELETVCADVIELLQELSDGGFVRT
jgi:pyrroloquinoline quinone biosynthesis protein D